MAELLKLKPFWGGRESCPVGSTLKMMTQASGQGGFQQEVAFEWVLHQEEEEPAVGDRGAGGGASGTRMTFFEEFGPLT